MNEILNELKREGEIGCENLFKWNVVARLISHHISKIRINMCFFSI